MCRFFPTSFCPSLRRLALPHRSHKKALRLTLFPSFSLSLPPQVKVTGILLSKLGACSRISYSTERTATPVDWTASDRLTPGTLVVMSPRWDYFRTKCIVATIATRSFNGRAVPDVEDGDSPFDLPRVELFFANISETLIDPIEDFVMLEAKTGYFENVRHTMLGLQHAAMYQ